MTTVAIRVRPPLAAMADVLGRAEVTVATEGQGWADILVGEVPVHLGLGTLRQAATVADRHTSLEIHDEPGWVTWLQAATNDPDRRAAARRALSEVCVAATVAALPRPLPGRAVGSPAITVRLGSGWLDRLRAARPNGAAVIGESRDNLARWLGIPLPPVSLRREDLPDGVFGICLGDLVLPLRAADAETTPFAAYEQIAAGLVTDIRRWADALVDEAVLERMLDEVENAIPGTVRAARRLVGTGRLLAAVRGLLAQRVPVAAFEPLLERLLAGAVLGPLAPSGSPPFPDGGTPEHELTRYVRAGLRRQIAAEAAASRGKIWAYVLADTGSEATPLDDTLSLGAPDGGFDTVLIVPPGSVEVVRRATQSAHPDLFIVGRDEIPEICDVLELGVFSLPTP